MKRVAVSVALAALALAACGAPTRVGDPRLLEGIKEASPSPSPTVRRTQAAKPSPRATRTQAAQPTPTQRRQQATFDLLIRQTQRGFEPQIFVVSKGTKVIFRNKDSDCTNKPSNPTCTHSWVADDGTWDSGPIPAGKTYTYVANEVGTFPFHDGEVPYNIGQMEVRAA